MQFRPELIRLLHDYKRVAALTGAGVSQESGVPTFRDAHPSTGSGQAGLWAKHKAEDLATPEAFRRDPKLVWDWYAERRERVDSVEPNPGHIALAEMARRVPHFTLITQNVDGLHQKAGSPQVIELHGNIRRVKCFDCGKPAPTWQVEGDQVPKCTFCGGLLRPDVVWFGELLPPGVLEAATQAARTCQAFFSIGTSALVHPAASLAYTAKNCGALLVEVNPEPTPLTPNVDFFLQGKSGKLLPELVQAVWGKK
jgi:NAD-dependent deacetylase